MYCKNKRKNMKKLFLLLILLCCVSCSYTELQIAKPHLHIDVPIQKSQLMTYVQPTSRQTTPLKALIYPMWINQLYPKRLELGKSFSHIFHNAWAQERLFPAQELDDSLIFRSSEKAVREARTRGADVVIILTCPYFYAGHTLDDTKITVQMDMYETTAGHLIYSMQQAAVIEFKAKEDWIFFAKENRMPADPLLGCLWSIAKDMAIPIKSWLPPYRPHALGFASSRSEIIQGLIAASANTPVSEMSAGTEIIQHDGAVYLNITFETNSAQINEKFYPQLNVLGDALSSSALYGKKIILAGHTDSDADAEFNLRLSKQRAEAVKNYLTQKFSINPNLIQTTGYGEDRPLMPNNSVANKQLNRRVEIRLASE